MVRLPLSPQERARGAKLGAILREARGQRSMVEVAAASGVPVETLRKIEAGRIPTPAFFTVVALASALDLPIEQVIVQCAMTDQAAPAAVRPVRWATSLG